MANCTLPVTCSSAYTHPVSLHITSTHTHAPHHQQANYPPHVRTDLEEGCGLSWEELLQSCELSWEHVRGQAVLRELWARIAQSHCVSRHSAAL